MAETVVHKASHCAWQIHYHVVFPVKYRRALLDEEVVKIITETAAEISQRYDIEFEQIGCDRDRIHLLCSAHPKVARGRIVRVFKSITARGIFRRKPSIKQALWGGEFWTDGCYVATVGEGGSWNVIERCVRNQGKIKDLLKIGYPVHKIFWYRGGMQERHAGLGKPGADHGQANERIS